MYDGPTKGAAYAPLDTMTDTEKAQFNSFTTPQPSFNTWQSATTVDALPEGLRKWGPMLLPADPNAPQVDPGLTDGWLAPNHTMDDMSSICAEHITVQVPDLTSDGKPQYDATGKVIMKPDTTRNKFYDLFQNSGVYDYICNTKEKERDILELLRNKLIRRDATGEDCNGLRDALVKLVQEKFAAEGDLYEMHKREQELQDVIIELTNYLRKIAASLLDRYSNGTYSGQGSPGIGLLRALPAAVTDPSGALDVNALGVFVASWKDIYETLDPSIQQLVDELEACNNSMPDMQDLKDQADENALKVQLLENEIDSLRSALALAEQQVVEANEKIKDLALKLIEMGWSMNRVRQYIDVAADEKPGEFYDRVPTNRPPLLPDGSYDMPTVGAAPFDTANIVRQATEARIRAEGIKETLDNLNFRGPFQPFPGDWIKRHDAAQTGAAANKAPFM